MKGFHQFLKESVADHSTEHELPILLADLHVVSIKVHNFHWNVRGPFFGPLHKLFDDIYGHLNEHIDVVAERMRALRLVAPGSMQEFLDLATIQETPGQLQPAKNMLLDLHTDLIDLSDRLNTIMNDVNDEGTKNMIADMIESIDKDAWFVRSHVATDEELEDNEREPEPEEEPEEDDDAADDEEADEEEDTDEDEEEE
jgi:starvation-inducible DNA-binding protein